MNELRVRGLDEGPFRAAVLDAVTRIPKGRVADVGDIAESIGYPREAEVLVGWALEAPVPDVPWHRVLLADGSLSRNDLRAQEQADLLSSEGVDLLPGPKVDLSRYRLKPVVPRRGPIPSSR